jgi:hypothetical protein
MPAVALFFWPIVPLVLFATLGARQGLITGALLGYLFLPEAIEFDLPGLPAYDKYSAISIGLGLAGLVSWKEGAGYEKNNRLVFYLLIALLAAIFLSPIGTVITNPETLINGPSVRPALGVSDLISITSHTVFWLTPAILAWRFLPDEDAHRQLLSTLVIFGLFYSLLALFEWRMSPQLHTWIYGYFQHSFLQHLRGGGFRPAVFLQHGLWVGLFLFMAVVAAATMSWQTKREARVLYAGAALWILVTLLLSYNLGAAMLALIFLPALLLLSRRLQLWLMLSVAVVFLSYPALRDVAQVPLDTFTARVAGLAPERAASFEFRMKHEESLLARALEKPAFGWGLWARGRVYDESGNDTSVSDGLWIIVFGERGWAGYLSLFGLVTLPLLALRSGRSIQSISPSTIGIAIILSGNLIYIIPNSAFSPISLLLVGALAGFISRDRRSAESTISANSANSAKGVRYTRFPVDQDLQPMADTSHSLSAKADPIGPRHQSRKSLPNGQGRYRRRG